MDPIADGSELGLVDQFDELQRAVTVIDGEFRRAAATRRAAADDLALEDDLFLERRRIESDGVRYTSV